MVDAVVIPTDVVVVHEGMFSRFLVNCLPWISLLVEIVVIAVVHLPLVIVVEMVVDHVRPTHVLLFHDGKNSLSNLQQRIFFCFSGGSRSRSKSNSPGYGKRNGGGAGASSGGGGGGRRISRSRSPTDN